jgi:copper chaperone CopZ
MMKSTIVAASLLLASGAMAIESNVAVSITADSAEMTLTVAKMTCGGCVAKVKSSLSTVEGIKKVSADSKTRKVVITIEDQAKFDIEKAIAAIKAKTGWDAVKE